ncbi:Phenmedipham hydrolase [Crateriforma conspicua]|nr:Phenmedipham hydrolase [Crateriforma conspicua]
MRLNRWMLTPLLLCIIVQWGRCDQPSGPGTPTAFAATESLGPVSRDAIYQVQVTRGQPYGQGMVYHPADPTRCFPRNLTLDIYQPDDGQSHRRPVVVLIHGGGFWTGDSLMRSMVNAAEYFARRGWVCFSINYRLSGDRAIAPDGWPDNRPTYAATRDAKMAVRWIRANADRYRIHPDRIVAYGGSAGAYISVALGASDEQDYRDELLDNPVESPLLESSHLDQSSRVQAVVNHWGSGLLVDSLQRFDGHSRWDTQDAPMLIIHGTEDQRVPYSHAIDLEKNYKARLKLCPLQGRGHSAWDGMIDGKPMIHTVYQFLVDELQLPVDQETPKRSNNR